MTRWSGVIGFSNSYNSTEVSPGIVEDVIVEREHLGVVEQRTETFDTVGSVIPEYRVTTSISVLAHGVDRRMYSEIRYVTFEGFKWAVTSVVHQWPRITLYIGDKYNGPGPIP